MGVGRHSTRKCSTTLAAWCAALLVLIGCESRQEATTTVESATDQTKLAKIAAEGKDRDVRRAAAQKVTDQHLLAAIAVKAEDGDVRRIAVETLTDQGSLAKIASEARWLDTRVAAIGKMTDQPLLQQWVENDPQVPIRQGAVRQITDDKFLVQRLPSEPSASVRAAIIETLREKPSLREVALTAYHEVDRQLAVGRLRRVFEDQAPDVAAAHEALDRRVKALAVETDGGKLATLALHAEFDILRIAAAQQLSDPAALEQAALRARDRDVQKMLLPKLGDKGMLDRIASASHDPAMRLAAAKKAGAKSWQEIFDAATATSATVEMLNDALAAVSLFPLEYKPGARLVFDTNDPLTGKVRLLGPLANEAVDAIKRACVNLIRRGDKSRIPEMVDLLERYGDDGLAIHYLNCGEPDLASAAQLWAYRHGYYEIKVPVSNFHPLRWGSGR